jgi:hypothetical protein
MVEVDFVDAKWMRGECWTAGNHWDGMRGDKKVYSLEPLAHEGAYSVKGGTSTISETSPNRHVETRRSH